MNYIPQVPSFGNGEIAVVGQAKLRSVRLNRISDQQTSLIEKLLDCFRGLADRAADKNSNLSLLQKAAQATIQHADSTGMTLEHQLTYLTISLLRMRYEKGFCLSSLILWLRQADALIFQNRRGIKVGSYTALLINNDIEGLLTSLTGSQAPSIKVSSKVIQLCLERAGLIDKLEDRRQTQPNVSTPKTDFQICERVLSGCITAIETVAGSNSCLYLMLYILFVRKGDSVFHYSQVMLSHLHKCSKTVSPQLSYLGNIVSSDNFHVSYQLSLELMSQPLAQLLGLMSVELGSSSDNVLLFDSDYYSNIRTGLLQSCASLSWVALIHGIQIYESTLRSHLFNEGQEGEEVNLALLRWLRYDEPVTWEAVELIESRLKDMLAHELFQHAEDYLSDLLQKYSYSAANPIRLVAYMLDFIKDYNAAPEKLTVLVKGCLTESPRTSLEDVLNFFESTYALNGRRPEINLSQLLQSRPFSQYSIDIVIKTTEFLESHRRLGIMEEEVEAVILRARTILPSWKNTFGSTHKLVQSIEKLLKAAELNTYNVTLQKDQKQ